jgi:hypothetical protein
MKTRVKGMPIRIEMYLAEAAPVVAMQTSTCELTISFERRVTGYPFNESREL